LFPLGLELGILGHPARSQSLHGMNYNGSREKDGKGTNVARRFNPDISTGLMLLSITVATIKTK
jgi:hypothetical protein